MRSRNTILLPAFLLLAFPLLAKPVVADSPAAMLAAGRADEAIATLQAQVNASPSDAASQNLLCRAYFMLASWDRGIAACEKAVTLDPNNSDYHLWMGRIYGEKADASSFFTAAGLAKKVRSEFERAVELNPANIPARTDLSEFYTEAPGIVGGGTDKARSQADALSKLDPGKAHWVSARIAEKKKDFTNAEKEYRAAIEASHGSANAWFNLALFYKHQKRLNEMEDAILHASTAPLDRPEVLMESADNLIRTGRNFPRAILLLRRYLSGPTVEEAPAFKAHYLLGSVLEKQGDKQAVEEYRAALALAKNFAPAQDALKRMNR